MSISFQIEGWGLRAGDGRVTLFKCDSSGRVEIRPYIRLASDDDYDEPEYFNCTQWSSAWRLYAHMIDILLPPAKTPEPCVAREATVEYVSNVLAIAHRSPLKYTDWTGETITMRSEDILEALKTQIFDDGSRFRILSGLGNRNLAMTNSMREQIKEETSRYLEALQFPSHVINTVQKAI